MYEALIKYFPWVPINVVKYKLSAECIYNSGFLQGKRRDWKSEQRGFQLVYFVFQFM